MGTGAPMIFRHMIHGKVSVFYFVVASDYVNKHYYPDCLVLCLVERCEA